MSGRCGRVGADPGTSCACLASSISVIESPSWPKSSRPDVPRRPRSAEPPSKLLHLKVEQGGLMTTASKLPPTLFLEMGAHTRTFRRSCSANTSVATHGRKVVTTSGAINRFLVDEFLSVYSY